MPGLTFQLTGESTMERFTRMLFTALLLISSNLLAGSVDINSADADTLASGLNGIGDAKARAIVAYRDEHGAFRSADELVQVKGIGQRLVDLNREVISIGSTATGESGD